ncbi:MAG: sulfite exporter TauE/SafE family protein [Thermodesulfobacteriota bacterium]
MTEEMIVLSGTAATIGFVHTVLGPDHYLPFIALAKARGWTGLKTLVITGFCGIGHVLGSIILGFLGILLGTVVLKLEFLESIRGDLAGWFLIVFGFTYFLWGLRHALRSKSHEHPHSHVDGESHTHSHSHQSAHSHVHSGNRSQTLTPWVLFIFFVLGPCEPLIPLIMYPAAKSSLGTVAGVALIFGLTTIITMLACVMTAFYGLSKISIPRAER